MKKTIASVALLLALVGAWTLAQEETEKATTETAQPAEKDDATKSVQDFLSAYAAAFNKQDLKTVLGMWAENCTHVDKATGERTEGREAIGKDLAKVFKEQPGTRLIGQVNSVRMITDNVAQVSGQTTVTSPTEPPQKSNFSGILVKQKDQWQISSAEESPVPLPMTAAEALSELEWLIGSWVDDSDEVKVDTRFRWSTNGSFLLRSYAVENKEGVISTGTQVIGWDPRSREIRSWSFDSDGSFGDGSWSKNGKTWVIRSSRTMADGQAASGTYVITPVDKDTMTVQLIGHEIEGELMPTRPPVKVVRAPEPKDPEKKPDDNKPTDN